MTKAKPTILSMAEQDKIIETFNNCPSGGFCFLDHYTAQTGEGEIASYYFQAGINYNNIVEKSLDELMKFKTGKGEQKIKVKCNTFVDDKGIYYNRDKKGTTRTPIEYEAEFRFDDDSVQAVVDDLLEQMAAPKKIKQAYDKEAKSLYSIEDKDERKVFYIRECLVIKKVVHVEGDRKVKYTTPEIALKNAIKRLLSVSKYRSFKIDGRFERIAIDKHAIFPEVELSDDNQLILY